MSAGKPPIRQLRSRWQDIQRQRLAVEVLDRLATGGSLDDLPLDEVAGRVDLRGLPPPRPTAVTRPENVRVVTDDGINLNFQFANTVGDISIDHQHLKDLDFTGATLPKIRFRHTTVENSKFDYVDSGYFALAAGTLRECSFVGATVRGVFAAKLDGVYNRLENIDFSHANLADTSCGTASFVDCDFSNANLDKVNFWQASLIRCKFAGVLRNVIFDGRVLKPEEKTVGNPMEDIDMTEVTAMEDVDFRGVNFSRVFLPNDRNLVVLSNPEQFVAQALASVGDSDSVPRKIARGRLLHIQKMVLSHNPGGHTFINLSRIRNDDARQLISDLIDKFGQVLDRVSPQPGPRSDS